MADKKDIKTVLQFLPQQLLTGNFLAILSVTKNGAKTTFDTYNLDSKAIRKSFDNLPRQATEILQEFTVDAIKQTNSIIHGKYKLGRAGVDYESFYQHAFEREIHHKFVRLKPFLHTIKWYHKKIEQTSKFVTSPCSFSTFTPHLQFEVISNEYELLIQTNIVLNGTQFQLNEFKRNHFFIESNNEYFILSLKDCQTLDWLEKSNPKQYSYDPKALVTNIIAVLEENYEVNRNDYFEQNIIETTPINRVMLSEISGSFLVLTPQWLYDGFLVEGAYKAQHETIKNGTVYLIKRDSTAELAFIKLLKDLHPNFIKQLNGYFYLNFAEAQKKQWFFKAFHLFLEKNIEVAGMDMLQHFRYSGFKAKTIVTVDDQQNDTIKLNLTLSFGDEIIPLTALQKMLLSGQKAILLKDGSLGILGEDWMHQYGTIIKHGKVEKNHIEVARWLALAEDTTKPEDQVLKIVINNNWWQKWQQWQKADEILIPLPTQINATLRQYQQKGFEWLVLLSEAGAGACLADDMGLGKTLQTISFLAYKLQQTASEKFLIVCPTSLVFNWVQELQKFAPYIQSLAYHGAQRNIDEISNPENNVIITTYGTLRSDIEKIKNIHFNVVVIDESHNIKNPAAIITKSVNQLQASMRIALSGTPVMNNTFDLYAQLNFLLPGMFGNRDFFKREYADAIDLDQDQDKINALQKLTAPFILRRTKEQVATDLPDKIESVLWCDMGPQQKAAYESIRDNVKNSVFLDIKQNGLGKSGLSVLNAMLKLRQACNSCALLTETEFISNESVKLEILIEELMNIVTNHKALVFSQFTSMLDLMEPVLKKQHIAFCRLDGTTPLSKRQELINNFQNKDSIEKVFLISLKSGNAGLNLTAADYVFIFDPWWNTAVEQQAIDRTHRIGQTKNVFAYKMICKDTIEEKIMQLQQRKKKLAADLIGAEEGFVKNLSEDDLNFLLS